MYQLYCVPYCPPQVLAVDLYISLAFCSRSINRITSPLCLHSSVYVSGQRQAVFYIAAEPNSLRVITLDLAAARARCTVFLTETNLESLCLCLSLPLGTTRLILILASSLFQACQPVAQVGKYLRS